ncbi:MAG: hypothetical protein WDO14_00990 [Bacteroidota bacterium]
MKNLVRKTSLQERELAKTIVELLKRERSVALKGGRESVKLPKEVVKLLNQIFSIMKQGKTVAVMAADKEIGVEETAKIVGYPVKVMMGLLDLGNIPFTGSGKNRKMLLSDVLAYKKEHERRQRILQAMAQESQDLGLGYQ